MYIRHITIKNFRALEDIDCPLGPRINVIVGPNGVGKTTILQAIRLTKALLAPRTQSETQQVLISLGAASPHFPQRIFLNSMARDSSRPIEVRATFELNQSEIATLQMSLPGLVQSVVSSQLGQAFANPTALISFLQSPAGEQARAAAQIQLTGGLDKLQREKTLVLGVTLNGHTGQIIASDPLAGLLVGFLDQRLPPSTSIFSYFPADRALPMGEVNLQLGGPDAQQQLESHNSQPQTKYVRLKNLIIGSLVLQEQGTETIHTEFEKIFSGLLKGRRIKSIGINELGLLSVMTEEISSGRIIELDSLSSGEKNIALTFLILARSVADGGIALFDEPELHLNPAVSRDLLPFIMTRYSKPRNIQFVMCTHAPEILSGAFSDEDCTLLHLKAASNISRIGKHALDEYSDALSRLGTSVSESLMYEGTILVEGVSDVDFLESGFPEVVKRFKVKDRGGRREVEQTVLELQRLESKHQKVSPIFLIFDRDEQPTNLKSSPAVKVLQWPRRCAENYMLDSDVITELLKDPSVTKTPMESEGEVRKLMRDLAYKQLDQIAAREVYKSYQYLDASLQSDDFKGTTIESLASSFYDRMAAARASISEVPKDQWTQDFVKAAEDRKQTLLKTWEAKWPELCDGKKLISDLHRAGSMKMSETTFKMRIVKGMRDASSETWQIVRGLLNDLLKPAP
jgi:energy-coupling factor transporter ATP-binding protein EcfA2